MKINMKIYSRLVVTLSLLYSALASGIVDVDFDHSSGLDLMHQYSAKYSEPEAEAKLKLLRDNYERLKPSKTISNSSPIIPKVIHQIWLGPKSISPNDQYNIKTWIGYHPNWEMKLWTEKEILKENFDNMDLYWSARSYQERSDIVRYEILKRYGGLYIDTDIECFANFDDLNHKYDFYTNFEPPAINKKRVSILNAMVASTPNHPIIIDTLNQIRKEWNNVEELFNTQYSNNKSSFSRSNHHLAVQRTMYPLADSVFRFLSKKESLKSKSMILPSGYNVPVYFVNDIPIINFLSRIFRDKAKLSNQIKKQPETMSIHFHDKENSLMHDDYFANSLFNHSEVKGMTYMLFSMRNKYYLAFRKMFQTRFPTLLSYKTDPVVPKVIYIDNSSNLSQKDLAELKNKWQIINPKFTIKVLNYSDLENIVPKELASLSPEIIKRIARFYLLKDNGGVYVDPSFVPANLIEFNYKYGYYGSFNKIKKLSDKLSLDTRIIAAVDNHSIMHNLTNDLEKRIAKNKDLTEDTIKDLYIEYVYRYCDIDGNSIVFPEIYFNQKR